jgi:hypothetical protein
MLSYELWGEMRGARGPSPGYDFQCVSLRRVLEYPPCALKGAWIR